MRKAASWIAALSAGILAISMMAMGTGVYEMDAEIIHITAYIALPCLVLLCAAAIVLRFRSSNCPHCGRYVPTNAVYCPCCGKKIQ